MHSDIERELRHRAQAIQTAEKDSVSNANITRSHCRNSVS